MFWVSRKNRLPLTVALLVGLILLGTILVHTHRALPAAGRTYSGTVDVLSPSGHSIDDDLPISFRIARTGDRVETFQFSSGLPHACRGTSVGGLDTGSASDSAAIVAPGRFLAEFPIDRDGSRVGTLIINGAFHSLGREDGAVQTTFRGAALKGCAADGSYSTTD